MDSPCIYIYIIYLFKVLNFIYVKLCLIYSDIYFSNWIVFSFKNIPSWWCSCNLSIFTALRCLFMSVTQFTYCIIDEHLGNLQLLLLWIIPICIFFYISPRYTCNHFFRVYIYEWTWVIFTCSNLLAGHKLFSLEVVLIYVTTNSIRVFL